MISKNAQSVIDQGNELLPTKKNSSVFELQEKAATFLLIEAKLASERRAIESALVRATSLEKAQLAETYSRVDGKTVNDKKVNAEADKAVLEVREEVGELENDITYVTTMLDIFKNAHFLYRQQLRQEQEV